LLDEQSNKIEFPYGYGGIPALPGEGLTSKIIEIASRC
jgi:hypothetical protein